MAKSRKSGLGRGLDSLIPESDIISVNTENLKTGEVVLKLSQIEPNRNQPRKKFDEDALAELADSIKEYGVIQPLVVQKRKDYYEIVAGERRWRAAQMAGIKEIPVVIKNYTEQEIMEIALIENIQREDLNPIEEAMAYKNLIDEFKLKQDEVAQRVSKSRAAITNSMRLLKLDSEVQRMLIEDMISSGHARALIPIENGELQIELANRVFDEKLSVRETEKLVKSIINPKKKREKPEIKNEFVYKDIEEKLKEKIGSKVKLNYKANGKGKIEIDYYSDDELERIFEMIMNIG